VPGAKVVGRCTAEPGIRLGELRIE
jgi:hypothetical protein